MRSRFILSSRKSPRPAADSPGGFEGARLSTRAAFSSPAAASTSESRGAPRTKQSPWPRSAASWVSWVSSPWTESAPELEALASSKQLCTTTTAAGPMSSPELPPPPPLILLLLRLPGLPPGLPTLLGPASPPGEPGELLCEDSCKIVSSSPTWLQSLGSCPGPSSTKSKTVCPPWLRTISNSNSAASAASADFFSASADFFSASAAAAA
mmetsp:Transcript_42361/g.95867  ORF Transcript_42361/g.95867 Transcript_42361/m.95867 type:complete len:210 (+) Transcript_42361:1090-1719(+)